MAKATKTPKKQMKKASGNGKAGNNRVITQEFGGSYMSGGGNIRKSSYENAPETTYVKKPIKRK